jgi:hypothetical protein
VGGAVVVILGSGLLASPCAAQVLLTNVTQASGLGNFSHTPNFLSVPSNYEWMLGGIAVGDYDGDGWPDLFVPRGGQGTDALFINNRDGTFTNRAVEWSVASAHAGNGATAADFDGDGDVDIFVTSYGTALTNLGQVGRNRLYRNEGGHFAEVAAQFGVQFTGAMISSGDGAAWGDIDLDGDLDLAVAAWVETALGNRLFRNDGQAFADLTGTAVDFGMRSGFQPTIVDLTGDGFPELLLAGDYETSGVFVNSGGSAFDSAEATLGLAVESNAMGSCVADLDGNGLPDWYVTSIHRAVPPKDRFNGNAFYLNGGDDGWTEQSVDRGCNDGGWGWGVVAVDLDHDGWEDLVEVNGVASGEWVDEQEYVFRNLGDGTFERLGNETGLQLANDVRCVATLDFDRDGDLDLVFLINRVGLRLYRNDADLDATSWLLLELGGGLGTACAPHGFGAVVELEAEGRVLRRWMHGGSGFRSSNEPVVHFGLGAATVIDRLEVFWPNGQSTRMQGVSPRQRLLIDPPSFGDLDGDGTVGVKDLAVVLECWGEIDRTQRDLRRADLDSDGRVGPRDLGALLEAWNSGS